MFGIMSDMDQKANCETALVVGIGSGLCMSGFAGFFTSLCVSFPGVQAQMLGANHGREHIARCKNQQHQPCTCRSRR